DRARGWAGQALRRANARDDAAIAHDDAGSGDAQDLSRGRHTPATRSERAGTTTRPAWSWSGTGPGVISRVDFWHAHVGSGFSRTGFSRTMRVLQSPRYASPS